MGFIIEGFLGLALLLAAIWLAFYLPTWRRERAQRAEEERAATVERTLRTPGERLCCVACQHEFVGPLPDEGCPQCHCAAFVVPAGPSAQAAAEPPRAATQAEARDSVPTVQPLRTGGER